MEKRKKPALKLTQAPALRQDLRLFAVLGVTEEDFLRQAAELEADPLLARLAAPGADGQAPLVRRRLPGASYAFFQACGSDALAAAAGAGSGAAEWLAGRPAMLALATRAGLVNFEKYFLSGSPFPRGEAERACGFTAREAADLKAFTEAFLMAHEHTPPAALPPLFLRCAATIYAEGGGLRAAYNHPAYFRGGYAINGPALTRLLKSGGLSRAEISRARVLAAAAQRLSWRKAGFHRVLGALIEEQKDFLLGRGPLKPFTQRELAARAGLNPGTVSRLISNRTLLTPRGEELALKSFFRPRSAYIIDKMREILGGGAMTDEKVAQALKREFGVRVSRRTVSLYRTKL